MVEARLRVPDEIAVRVHAGAMRGTIVEIFRALGMSAADARQSADVLIWADLRGIETHGASNMMPAYVRGLREGTINPKPELRVLREAGATATVDNDSGLGLAVGPKLMRMAIAKARNHGIGAVTAAHGRHFGAAGYHAWLALEHDMIGIAMTVGGLSVAPTFGSQAMVGLNPLAVAVPAEREPPFVFDASMSSVAGNKIRLAKRLGATVPGGWVADADGTPRMNESEVTDDYLMLPLGGTRTIGSHKGFSLAMMVDVLSGLLAGTGPGFQAKRDVSHHFLAYRIDAFTDSGGFKTQMDIYLRGLQDTPPAPGEARVVYAGLQSHENELERRQRGIPYHPEVVAYYRELAAELGFQDRLEGD
ncbi:MAG TPA: Ldh family oxidoreductase [Dehalococcoidia bacterium]|nr:Ldh family oxidoreductase [Dehalococcoidia bacterium]